MKVKVGNAVLAGELGEFLEREAGAVVDTIDGGELEVCLVGSFNDMAMREEIAHAARHWSLLRNPGATVRIG